ncbi:discoidin domain-containing protein [Salmonella enterica]|nr:discoidin domain-containing protein [Salmonella enterica]EGA0603427.1 discoidin domain-containing protein [Salmonella enterica]EHD2148897.1 discoidin domain-containing protein [Salmonella enterica]EHK2353386.1 discoidin domain-containing protein [Salmonella enterica]
MMNKFIPERNEKQVAIGDVASMYSPAAYLTKLWIEANRLHPVDHPNSIRSRRYDIGQLLLNQNNMDTPVSTLDLSNALLIERFLQKGIRARYVLIRRTPNNNVNTYMGFTELEVFSEGVNRALGAPVRSSTGTWFSGQGGENLVDGNKYSTPASTSSNVSGDCWFLIDLGAEYEIDKITLYGRSNSQDAPNRERDMAIFALPAAILPAGIATTPAAMPNYATLRVMSGVYSYSWTTKNDKDQEIVAGVENTYTLNYDNAMYMGVAVKSWIDRLATSGESGYYHQPLNILRGVMAGLPADVATLLTDKDVADRIFSGISPLAPAGEANSVARQAQIWRLTQFYGVNEEDARVMCGFDISQSTGNNSITGKAIPSQFDRLFGKQGATLLSSKDTATLNQILMNAFSVNAEVLAQVAALAGLNNVSAITVSQASALYSWVLLSRSLGCTVSELAILKEFTQPVNDWSRYGTFRAALDWMVAQNISFDVLVRMLIIPYPVQAIPPINNVMDALKREHAMPGGMTRHTLESVFSTVYGLSSAGQAKAVIDWLDTAIPATDINSNDFMRLAGGVRYVMLRRNAPQCFDVAEVEVQINGENVALNKTVTMGEQGEHVSGRVRNIVDGSATTFYASAGGDSHPGNLNAWVQIDLGETYVVDSIKLTPRESMSARMTNCHIYVSDSDMRDWARATAPGATDPRFTLVGQTNSNGQLNPQSFAVKNESKMQTYLGRLTQYMLAVSSLGLTEDIVSALASNPNMVSHTNTPEFSLSRLRELSQLNAVVSRCVVDAPALIKQLANNQLTVTALSHFTRLDEDIVKQALPAGQSATGVITLATVIQTLDTVQTGQLTGLSLTNIRELRNLRNNSALATWQSIAAALMAEMPASARTDLQQTLAEGLSDALTNMLLRSREPVAKTRYVVIYVQPDQAVADFFLAQTFLVDDRTVPHASIYSSAGWDNAYPATNMLNMNADLKAKTDRKLVPGDWIVIDLKESYPCRSIFLEESYAKIHSYCTMFTLEDGTLPANLSTNNMPGYAEIMAKAISYVSWQRKNDQNNTHSLNIPLRTRFKTRDEISDYLLIDPQMGAQTQTSPLAWAIASVQLYINRCLNENETGVIENPRDLLFFANWERYNKRYSQWSGLKQLLQEPENFLDPSLRLRATQAFKNLQQQLESTQLKEEAAEEAFMGYLSEFEELADMSVISAHHDTLSPNNGETWFIGRSKVAQPNWYWRSLDHSKLINGANQQLAWSGWEKIDLPIKTEYSPYPTVQAFKFNNRWYVAWLEFHKQGTKTSTSQVDNDVNLILKIAQRRYDGSWRQLPDNLFKDNELSGSLQAWARQTHLGFYLTVEQGVNKPVIQLYSIRCETKAWYVDITDGTHSVSKFIPVPRSDTDSDALVISIPGSTGLTPYNHYSWTHPGSLGPKSQYNLATLTFSGRTVSLTSDFPKTLRQLASRGLDSLFSLQGIRDVNNLDFSGAFGIYYWELFYHVPQLISQCLREQQDYNGAAKWLGFIFNPVKYPSSSPDNRYWNPLPLANDNTWDVLDTTTTDPDVIAETDPMHYKLATFMRQLDLLLARGDAAYRMLERDTLVEAGMWYQQALNLLGEQRVATSTPTLPVLNRVNVSDFLPEENEKLSGYWQLLRQRQFNLRHNLTLDGQPMQLTLFAKRGNPNDLLSATQASVDDIKMLPNGKMGLLRFKPALEQARSLAGQLVQFGSSLLNITERQDGEAMNQLLQNQARQLLKVTLDIQDRTLSELSTELQVLQAQKANVTLRRDYYNRQLDEGVSTSELAALGLNNSVAPLLAGAAVSYGIAGSLDTAPNIFGVATGGNRWGAIANGIGAALSSSASAASSVAGVLLTTDNYRRRQEEWTLQKETADYELQQIEYQLQSLEIRREAAVMQNTSLLIQQQHADKQLNFLKSKFSSQQLYSWLRSRLSTIFYQFYDVAVTASLQAQEAWRWETLDTARQFIRPGAWQNGRSGLLCGEALLLDLALMESAWIDWNKRALEVTRTVSIASELKGATPVDPTVPDLPEAIRKLLGNKGGFSWVVGSGTSALRHELKMGSDDILECRINLAALKIPADYPEALGKVRRIKNISVSLPALVGPYQDVRAVLGYSESGVTLPAGCSAIAVSHGVNDSGQFQLDFNDLRYLPFEGVKLPKPEQDNQGTLTLSFPSAMTTQKALLASLNDIILHIHYTIRD